MISSTSSTDANRFLCESRIRSGFPPWVDRNRFISSGILKLNTNNINISKIIINTFQFVLDFTAESFVIFVAKDNSFYLRLVHKFVTVTVPKVPKRICDIFFDDVIFQRYKKWKYYNTWNFFKIIIIMIKETMI